MDASAHTASDRLSSVLHSRPGVRVGVGLSSGIKRTSSRLIAYWETMVAISVLLTNSNVGAIAFISATTIGALLKIVWVMRLTRHAG